jgi:LDH2 family malate/lactate/ureidoglycolate dehydrogenase
MAEEVFVDIGLLTEFCTDIFKTLGVPKEDAKIAAEIIVTADRRGIASHGTQRLRRYVNLIKTGNGNPKAVLKILKETPNTLLISGDNGLGQVVAYKVMKLVIEKALKNNLAFAAVRDSNHFGIAGYYAMMALKHDLIGICLTNTAPLVVPTFGKNAIIGTNPIAIAVPAGRERPFVLDMGTSTVVRGKLEIYYKAGKPIPQTWATDEFGKPTQDVSRVLKNLLERKGGGLLPLGGSEEESGGHKGYGLSLLVDILCGVLSGGAFGTQIYGKKGLPPGVCHFLGAIKIDAFIDVELFKQRIDEYIRMLKTSPKAVGKDRIFIHGEKEYELYERYREKVPLLPVVIDELRAIGRELGVNVPF